MFQSRFGSFFGSFFAFFKPFFVSIYPARGIPTLVDPLQAEEHNEPDPYAPSSRAPSFRAQAVAELRAADPRKFPRGHDANASSGENLVLQDGAAAAPRTRNQDSQHKLNQPRVSFPDKSEEESMRITEKMFQANTLMESTDAEFDL